MCPISYEIKEMQMDMWSDVIPVQQMSYNLEILTAYYIHEAEGRENSPSLRTVRVGAS